MVTDHFKRPLRDLRISVTDRCNFRCPYCMPAEIFGEHYRFLPREQLLTYEEITQVARVFVKLGVRKLRITGGEPLVRENIETLIAMLATIDGVDDIAMTTNSYLLPRKADALKAAGLHRLTISLDSLDDAVFQKMNGGRSSVQKVLDGITAAEQAGFSPLKINAVVQRGVNDHTLVELARHFKERGHIMRFIEYMDVGTMNGWRLDEVVPAKEIIERINAELPLEPIDPNYRGEVAKRYRYRDGGGEIGLITSVTQPFCGACSRIRLSAEGELFTCLFAAKGTDIRTLMRENASDDVLEQFITQLWSKRTDRYSEVRASLTKPRDSKVEMYHIGG